MAAEDMQTDIPAAGECSASSCAERCCYATRPCNRSAILHAPTLPAHARRATCAAVPAEQAKAEEPTVEAGDEATSPAVEVENLTVSDALLDCVLL